MTVTTSTTSLARIAREYAAAMPWRPWFTPQGRWSRRVLVTESFEVWLLAWLPGQGTELHDHGGLSRPGRAAFAVAAGRLTEYRVAPGEEPRLLKREFGEGDTADVDDRAVHAVVNTADTPAVSVHVYAPRLEMMRRYLFNESGLWLASTVRPGGDWSVRGDGSPRDREGAVPAP